jgi:hypothetical protein
VELYTPLNVQVGRRKLPDATIQLLGSEAGTHHGTQEVDPRDLSYIASRAGSEEKSIEDFEGGGRDFEHWLLVGLCSGWKRSLLGIFSLGVWFDADFLRFDLLLRRFGGDLLIGRGAIRPCVIDS